MKGTLSRLGHVVCVLTLATVSSFVSPQTSAESPLPPIDDRCEITKTYLSFQRRVFRFCDMEFKNCVEERMSRFTESNDEASDHCWNRPLSIDLDFDGPCPTHMEELDTRTNNDSESLMQLVVVRNHFNSRNEFGADIDVFKRNESILDMRTVLASDSNNPVALKLLSWTLLFTDDLVERLNVELREQELDPDCPNSRSLFLHGIFGLMDELVDNWLDGNGPGSELSTSEMTELFARMRQTLLELYDHAIEDGDHTGKLHWALDSISDAILTREFENFQLLSRYVEVELDDYADIRRATLVKKFSNEYDIDSDHGRSQSLTSMCSSHALDLGLLDHCVKLLNHFGLSDASHRDSPAPDWSRAAISLMIGLTRDCSDHANWLLHGPSWWNVRPCVADHRLILASKLRELLDGFSEVNDSAEREALEAFLHLDETSDERFMRALAIDNSLAVYASRLGKRLHRLGDVETASNVLSGVDAEMKSELPNSEKDLLDNTWKAVEEGKYQNWMESSWDL